MSQMFKRASALLCAAALSLGVLPWGALQVSAADKNKSGISLAVELSGATAVGQKQFVKPGAVLTAQVFLNGANKDRINGLGLDVTLEGPAVLKITENVEVATSKENETVSLFEDEGKFHIVYVPIKESGYLAPQADAHAHIGTASITVNADAKDGSKLHLVNNEVQAEVAVNGNSAEKMPVTLPSEVLVDATAPVLTVDGGKLPESGFDYPAVVVVSDTGSGVASASGGTWLEANSTLTIPETGNQVELTAQDRVGNTTTVTVPLKLEAWGNAKTLLSGLNENASAQQVQAARAAYDALSAGAKKHFPEDLLKKLLAAEKTSATDSLQDAIAALPSAESILWSHRDAVEAVEAKYNDYLKNYGEFAGDASRLTAARGALDAIQKMAVDVNQQLQQLPDAKQLKYTDFAAVEAAQKALDALNAKGYPAEELSGYKKYTAAAEQVKTIQAEIAALKNELDALPITQEAVKAGDDQKCEALQKRVDELSSRSGVPTAVYQGSYDRLEQCRSAYKAAITDKQTAFDAKLAQMEEYVPGGKVQQYDAAMQLRGEIKALQTALEAKGVKLQGLDRLAAAEKALDAMTQKMQDLRKANKELLNMDPNKLSEAQRQQVLALHSEVVALTQQGAALETVLDGAENVKKYNALLGKVQTELDAIAEVEKALNTALKGVQVNYSHKTQVQNLRNQVEGLKASHGIQPERLDQAAYKLLTDAESLLKLIESDAAELNKDFENLPFKAAMKYSDVATVNELEQRVEKLTAQKYDCSQLAAYPKYQENVAQRNVILGDVDRAQKMIQALPEPAKLMWNDLPQVDEAQKAFDALKKYGIPEEAPTTLAANIKNGAPDFEAMQAALAKAQEEKTKIHGLLTTAQEKVGQLPGQGEVKYGDNGAEGKVGAAQNAAAAAQKRGVPAGEYDQNGVIQARATEYDREIAQPIRRMDEKMQTLETSKDKVTYVSDLQYKDLEKEMERLNKERNVPQDETAYPSHAKLVAAKTAYAEGIEKPLAAAKDLMKKANTPEKVKEAQKAIDQLSAKGTPFIAEVYEQETLDQFRKNVDKAADTLIDSFKKDHGPKLVEQHKTNKFTKEVVDAAWGDLETLKNAPYNRKTEALEKALSFVDQDGKTYSLVQLTAIGHSSVYPAPSPADPEPEAPKKPVPTQAPAPTPTRKPKHPNKKPVPTETPESAPQSTPEVQPTPEATVKPDEGGSTQQPQEQQEEVNAVREGLSATQTVLLVAAVVLALAAVVVIIVAVRRR